MSKFEKAKARILQKPKDYTYTEARNLLKKLGFEEYNKGKTPGAVNDLMTYLKELGDI